MNTPAKPPAKQNDPYTVQTLDASRRIVELEGQIKVLRQQRRLLYQEIAESGVRHKMTPEFFDAFRWLETLAQTTPGAMPGAPARRQEDRAKLLLAALLTHYEATLTTTPDPSEATSVAA